MLFLANFDPPPPVTLCHTSRDTPESTSHITDPPPRFLVGLVQKSRTKVPSTNSISIVHGGFYPGGFVRVDFCPFPLLSQYICYNRKLNITLNFMFYIVSASRCLRLVCLAQGFSSGGSYSRLELLSPTRRLETKTSRFTLGFNSSQNIRRSVQ